MSKLGKTTLLPLILTCEDSVFYLDPTETGFVLSSNKANAPIHQLQEPILLINGIATSSDLVHLVYLKRTGDLCYSVFTNHGQRQTNVLSTLDVRNNRYRQLRVFAFGSAIHIFYAYAHQSINDLWRIEHLYWNGKAWQVFHLGEIVHPRQPLYNVSIDAQRNLQLLMLTHQGHYSILLANRFNNAFNLWGNRTEALSIPHGVIDMAALITSDNSHHLFWVAKTSTNQLIVGWARKKDAHELTGAWQSSPSPLNTCQPPWHGLGVIEVNDQLWLLCDAAQQDLLVSKNGKWALSLSQQLHRQQFQLIHKYNKFPAQSYWVKPNNLRIPAFASELGLPNFHPKNISPAAQLPLSMPIRPEIPVLPVSAPAPIIQPSPQPIPTVQLEPTAQLEPTTPFAQIPSPYSLPDRETIDSLLKAVEDLTAEKKQFTQTFETLLSKFVQTDSSIEKLEEQIVLLREENELMSEKGFWRKWFK